MGNGSNKHSNVRDREIHIKSEEWRNKDTIKEVSYNHGEKMTNEHNIAKHCMMCDDVYYKGTRMPKKEYHKAYTNKDYTTGVCSQDECIEKYLGLYTLDEGLATLIRTDLKTRGW